MATPVVPTPVIRSTIGKEVEIFLGRNAGFCDLPECPYRGLRAPNGAARYDFTCWADGRDSVESCNAADTSHCKYRTQH